MEEKKFPKISKSIQDFFEDEDGSITRNKALLMGGMILVLGMLWEYPKVCVNLQTDVR